MENLDSLLPLLPLEKIIDYCDVYTMLNMRRSCKAFNKILMKRFRRVESLTIQISSVAAREIETLPPEIDDPECWIIYIDELQKFWSDMPDASQSIRKLFPRVEFLTVNFFAFLDNFHQQSLFIRSLMFAYRDTLTFLHLHPINPEGEICIPYFSFTNMNFTMKNLETLQIDQFADKIKFSKKYFPELLNLQFLQSFLPCNLKLPLKIAVYSLDIPYFDNLCKTKFYVQNLTLVLFIRNFTNWFNVRILLFFFYFS